MVFYAQEAHISFLTVVSWFLIRFVIGGSSPSRANKFLFAPAPPPPSVWALKPPSGALVQKTTYASIMIYAAMCIIFWMRAFPLLGQVGGGWALKFLILGPKWHSPIGLIPFHRAQKTLNFQVPTPSHLPSSWICSNAKHYPRGCINHRCINSYYLLLHYIFFSKDTWADWPQAARLLAKRMGVRHDLSLLWRHLVLIQNNWRNRLVA